MREFIRHPTDIPIEVAAGTLAGNLAATRQLGRNVSYGGLAFRSERALAPGSIVRLRIASVQPAFETDARVVWCLPNANRHGKQFEIGATFLQQHDAFCARMVEQVCHIETYRKDVLQNEGRLLSSEEAAREWVEKFAASFPNPSQP